MVLQDCGAQLGSPLWITGGQGAARATSALTSTALSAELQLQTCRRSQVKACFLSRALRKLAPKDLRSLQSIPAKGGAEDKVTTRVLCPRA